MKHRLYIYRGCALASRPDLDYCLSLPSPLAVACALSIMVRSRDRTPSPPLHRRWGGRARTSPPATPPSPPSPAASSESSLPERVRTYPTLPQISSCSSKSTHAVRSSIFASHVQFQMVLESKNLSRLSVADLYVNLLDWGWCDEDRSRASPLLHRIV